MLMTVDELKNLVSTTEPDQLLAFKLLALERMIRGYTNNSFRDTNAGARQ